jgi:hypothetical protein
MIFFRVLALLLIFTNASLAQTPSKTIRYDGRLEQNGQPVDGLTDFSFALYDSAQGGVKLWPADPSTSAPLRVNVSQGHFVVELGGQGFEPLPSQIFARMQIFLEIRIGGVLLNGRRAINAVPFAVHAQEADHAVSADEAINFNVTETLSARRVDTQDGVYFGSIERIYRSLADLLRTPNSVKIDKNLDVNGTIRGTLSIRRNVLSTPIPHFETDPNNPLYYAYSPCATDEILISGGCSSGTGYLNLYSFYPDLTINKFVCRYLNNASDRQPRSVSAYALCQKKGTPN